jgi:hypothetical protein
MAWKDFPLLTNSRTARGQFERLRHLLKGLINHIEAVALACERRKSMSEKISQFAATGSGMWASSVAANKDDWIVPLESFAELVYSADSTREVKPLR